MSKRSGTGTARRAVSGAFIFVGLFVIFFGLGFGSLTVILAGVALLLLSAAGRLLTTLRGTVRQWIAGTGQVAEVNDPPPSAPYGRCELQLVVEAAGLPTETVVVREPRLSRDQWPYPGQRLPIEVAADDIRNVRILWREYATERETAADGGSQDGRDGGSQEERHGGSWDEPDDAPTEEALPVDPDPIDFALDGPPTTVLTDTATATGGADAGHPGPVPRPRPTPWPRTPAEDRSGTDPSATDPSGTESVRTLPRTEVSDLVHGVGLTLHVAELVRSIDFYRELLGFRELDRADGGAVLASGRTRLVLREAPRMDPIRRRVVHLHLEVADLRAAYDSLRLGGVQFTSPPRVVTRGARLEQWAAAFRDPDGHGIALTEWRATDTG